MTDTASPWLDVARSDIGLDENVSPATVVGHARYIGQRFPRTASYYAGYTNASAQAWCGVEAGYCMAMCGIEPPFDPTDELKSGMWAASWRTWGDPCELKPGAVVCLEHHVTICESIDGDYAVCIGGNQSDQVKRSRYARSSILATRWPSAVAASPAAPVSSAPAGRHTHIISTIFGGTDDHQTSAYDDHVIGEDELGCSLPARFPRPVPKVRVYYGNRNVVLPLIDVGPWNTHDPYWNTPDGRPQSETGTDTTDRKTNRAGIDITPAAARALGMDEAVGKYVVDWEFADGIATVSPAPTQEPPVVDQPAPAPAPVQPPSSPQAAPQQSAPPAIQLPTLDPQTKAEILALAKSAFQAAASDPAVRAAIGSLVTKVIGGGALASLGPLGAVLGAVLTALWGFGQVGDAGLIGTSTATAVGAAGGAAVLTHMLSIGQTIASNFKTFVQHVIKQG